MTGIGGFAPAVDSKFCSSAQSGAFRRELRAEICVQT
jgi:hypothetical protein